MLVLRTRAAGEFFAETGSLEDCDCWPSVPHRRCSSLRSSSAAGSQRGRLVSPERQQWEESEKTVRAEEKRSRSQRPNISNMTHAVRSCKLILVSITNVSLKSPRNEKNPPFIYFE